MTSFTAGTGASAREAVGRFVSAIGGPRGASRGPLSSSIGVGQALGALLAGVAVTGLDEALRSEGLGHLVGRSPHEVIAGIADHLCGDPGPLDAAVVRTAVIHVLAEIFDESEDSYEELRTRWTAEVDVPALVQLMSLFIAQIIFQRFLADLGERIEARALSAAQAAEREQEVLGFIKAMVVFELGEIDPLTFDWRGAEGARLIDRNLAAALAQLEI